MISNRILALFLFAKFANIFNSLVSFSYRGYFFLNFPHLFFIGWSFAFLSGPALYFYSKSLAYRNFSFKKKDAIHLVPFLIHSIYMILNFHIYNVDVKRDILISGSIHESSVNLIFAGFFHLMILCYLIASFIILKNYRIEIKKIFSTVHQINLSWLKFLLIGFSIIWTIDVLNFGVGIFTDALLYQFSLPVLALVFFFVNIIVYKGLKQPEIFAGLSEKPKYQSSSLAESDQRKHFKQVLDYMESEKPYLEPSLNLHDLAAKLSIPSRHLSQIINDSLKQNFYDFINNYRVEEAKLHLRDSNNNHKTILEVLYEVGFNAKSTFNYAFKKHTGMTPSEYKKLH